ncbi:fluoride efflux transporter CrcB [Vreelandella hamiltonii]|uniref:Fluoride-specific ion channel FluC n=1 Tax=Vreelandella hamiltonii TaxID=502829 RepID=A0A8H9IMS5_9GAMM|nr:fluoride efflux transporter CrcB [Halomonas hamiltonii]ATH76386.1 fluoride efflux transporter CrcB [Halomonas hydrothermalis]KHJ52345.1 chromosome condensation protein CrcB [Halomonas hydrothermalis]GHD53981.1 putative fluoride ion transporter CrcB [Halomonas hamiltonii]
MNAYLAVGLGSAVGSLLRYGVSLASLAALGSYFPWGTLLVNIVGSLLIGWLAATASRFPHRALARHQPLLVAGFCGGFTTFSLFSLETLYLAQQPQWWLAPLYVLVSVPLWLLAAWAGERWALASSPAAE